MKFVTGNTPNPSQSNAPITAASIFAGMMNTSGESAHGTSFEDISLFDPEEIPDVSDLVELATINNESVHQLVSLTPINDNLSTVTMVDQPIIDNDNQPIIDNDNQPIIDNDNQPITNNDNQPITDNDNQPIIDNDNQPIIDNGRDNDVSHKPVVESCEGHKTDKKDSNNNHEKVPPTEEFDDIRGNSDETTDDEYQIPRKRIRTSQDRLTRDQTKYPLRDCKTEEETCKKQCMQLISHDRRKEIWASFWNLNYNERKNWLLHNVKRVTLGFDKKNDKAVTTALRCPIGSVISKADRRGTHEPSNKIDR